MYTDYYIYKIQENNFLEEFKAPLTNQVGDIFKWVETHGKNLGQIIEVKVLEIDHNNKTVLCREIN